MEAACLVGAAIAAATSAFSLLGDGEELLRLLSVERARRTLLALARALRELGRTRPLVLVGELGPVRSVAERAAAGTLVRALGLDDQAVVAALLCLLGLLTVASGLALGSPVAGVAVGAVVVALVVAQELARARRARREVAAAMPGIYRTLSVALGSGQTLAQAVAYVGSHERGPAAGVFARMSLRLRCGVSTEDAVSELARELEVSGAELLAAALVISHRTGSPLRELLMRSARLAERQGEFERLLAVKTAQVRLSVRIVCTLPAAMVAILAIISPDFQSGLLTPVGMGCLVLAAALDALALVLIRRLVRVVA